MSFEEEFSFSAETFTGVARLFPLPNLVMFPHVLQPLHIFEPRYRSLVEDAIKSDGLICISTLCPGWEPHYEEAPEIYPVSCLGKIVTYQRLVNGRFNLLLEGVSRCEIIKEHKSTDLYRSAEVTLLDDEYLAVSAAERLILRQQLISSFRGVVPQSETAEQSINELLGRDLPLGALTDIVAYSLELSLELKQQLLTERNVDQRALCLIEALEELAVPTEEASYCQPFPPDFSSN